jgi:GT2 family glycosyltransferase
MNAAGFRVLPFVGLLFPFDCIVAAVLLLSELARAPLRLFRSPPPQFPQADITSVTIQILNWDGRHLLEEFLPSVIAAAAGQKVVVVDNGSSDGSVELLRERFPGVGVVTLNRNHGFSIGNNLGIARIQSDVVILINNDMAVDEGFLQPLLAPFSDPAVFAVASRVSVPDPAKAHHESGKTHGKFEAGLFYLWHDPVETPDRSAESARTMPVFWAGGGACAIDRRKFEAVGGFDRLYHPFYVEDVDLSYQAWKRGWKSLMAPGSRVLHKHRGTSGPRFGDDFVNNTTRRNLFLLVWKNVTDPGMIFEHVLQLPRIHVRAMLEYGVAFEIRAYLRAILRLPLAIRRRLANAPAYILGDRDILRASR